MYVISGERSWKKVGKTSKKKVREKCRGKSSLRSRRLEVVGERENRRARGSVSFSRASFFFRPLVPSAATQAKEKVERKVEKKVRKEVEKKVGKKVGKIVGGKMSGKKFEKKVKKGKIEHKICMALQYGALYLSRLKVLRFFVVQNKQTLPRFSLKLIR